MIKTLLALTAVLSAGLVFAGEIKTLVPDTVPAPFKNRFSHGKIVPADAGLASAGTPTAVLVGLKSAPKCLFRAAIMADRSFGSR